MLPKEYQDEQLCRIALSLIEGIGPKTARALMEHFGSAKEAMLAPVKTMTKISGMGDVRAKACKNPAIFRQAEAELKFVLSHGIRQFFLPDEDYPLRLRQCADAPLLFNFKGNAPVETQHMVAIVGTRKNTDYGRQLTEELIRQLRGLEGLTVVSGLAHGIDAVAHRCCVAEGVPTIGVLAHGLDKLYPPSHRELAKQMLNCGGLLSEFPSGTKPDRTNFPVRNRIVAGLCDVTIVVESDEKGGAMITAYMAASYNREVAAFPGRVNDAKSAGPLKLIGRNIASLIRNGDDLIQVMGWAKEEKKKVVQPQLFLALNEAEQSLVDALRGKDAAHADELLYHTGFAAPVLSATLLQIEMQGIVRSLPGKRYRLS